MKLSWHSFITKCLMTIHIVQEKYNLHQQYEFCQNAQRFSLHEHVIFTCHAGEARSDLRAWPSSVLGWKIFMQLTECRTRKFSPNLNRPLVWAGGIEMELPVLWTHVSPIFAPSSLIQPFHFPPFSHLSSTEHYSTSDIDAHIIDEHHDHAYFAIALPRESRHLRNVDLAFSNPTRFHLAQGPSIPHFQHEHST